MSTLFNFWRALRPKQWTKNAVVLAALVFALGDKTQAAPGSEAVIAALGAAFAFCLISSSIYLMNDIRDLPQDRLHPTKRLRPLAAGAISIRAAATLAIVLLAAGLALAWSIQPDFLLVAAGYVVLQVLYTFGLKRIALLDLFIIATGFVLRALAGAVAVQVSISPWLLLCTLLLALFLALCKRRHEKVVLQDEAGQTRENLRQYDERLLDQLIAIIAGATLVCYALYTLAPARCRSRSRQSHSITSTSGAGAAWPSRAAPSRLSSEPRLPASWSHAGTP